MKTTIKAKIVIETDKFAGYNEDNGKYMITLQKIKEEIQKGHYIVEWVNSELQNEQEPTVIIKI